MNIIPSLKLTIRKILEEKAIWDKIVPFALSFDLTEITRTDLSLDSNFDTLTIPNLRFILYTEQRKFNHFGSEPDARTMQKIYKILDLIRQNYKG